MRLLARKSSKNSRVRKSADADYIENLRNELYMQELEEQARIREREELEKREKIK